MLFDLEGGLEEAARISETVGVGDVHAFAPTMDALHAGRAPPDEAIYFVGEEDLVSERGVVGVARIEGVDPERTEGRIRAVLEAQAKRWVGPLLNHPIYARRPAIFRGARGMWGGLDASGLIEPALTALLNRRVAYLNGCEF